MFYGPLIKADIDRISGTRPIIVCQPSTHEFYLNSAAEKTYGIDRTWFDALPKTAAEVAQPFHVRRGLQFLQRDFRANGVIAGVEPEGIASRIDLPCLGVHYQRFSLLKW